MKIFDFIEEIFYVGKVLVIFKEFVFELFFFQRYVVEMFLVIDYIKLIVIYSYGGFDYYVICGSV